MIKQSIKNKTFSTIIKTTLFWHKDGHTDQWNRKKGPETKLCIYGKVSFDKGANHSMGEKAIFSTNGAEETEYPLQQNEVGKIA